MAAEHSTVLALAEIALSAEGARSFRNEMGVGFVGKYAGEYDSSAGHVIEVLGGRRVTYGVQNPGGSDLIGWRPRIIEPWMLGLRIAQFLACECKTQGYDRASEEQKQFLGEVYRAGGVALIARRDGDGVRFEEVEG